jgi:hypothetical protein
LIYKHEALTPAAAAAAAAVPALQHQTSTNHKPIPTLQLAVVINVSYAGCNPDRRTFEILCDFWEWRHSIVL